MKDKKAKEKPIDGYEVKSFEEKLRDLRRKQKYSFEVIHALTHWKDDTGDYVISTERLKQIVKENYKDV